MAKLTTTTVNSAEPGPKDWFLWDAEIKGFGLKITPAGAKVFIYQYRSPEGRSRRLTIGQQSESLTAHQARELAKGKAFEVHSGRDPMAEKHARRNALTVDELIDLYVASEQFKGNAESTQYVDTGRANRHLRPLLGREFVDSVTREKVLKAHRAIRDGKTAVKAKTKARGLAIVTGGTGTADKALILLSAIYSWAIENKLATANPIAGMKFAPSGERDTIVADARGYSRLFDTLQTMENEKRIRAAQADAIRLIALTGARKSEVAGLRWKFVDLKSAVITIPARTHKTGRKTGKPRRIALPAEAQAIIAGQPTGEPDDYVFQPAKGDGGALSLKVWDTVRDEAKLPPNLGLHGLRHSVGSHLAMAGASAVELMEQLGHKQISTTLRYIHLTEQARSTLADRAASVAMAGLHGRTKTASVTKLPAKRRRA